MNDLGRQSGVATFTPRARLLRLIGSELISDEVVAITELVKNAHDADATTVSIQFIGVTRSEGELLVRDDGHGMDLETLLTRWMVPAGSAKGHEGGRHTARGRRVLGEKGVGRFAADKLASRLELVSRATGEPDEIHAMFDWDEFASEDRMLQDVQSRWELRRPDWLDGHGTVLRMTGLRTQWNERLFRRLSTRLSRLVSPFRGSTGFSIHIESDEFPEYAGEVTGYLDDAPHRVEVEYDGAQALTVRMNGERPTRQIWSGERLTCGPVRARLFAFDLETDALARIGPRAEVRAWLREWSGVSVYRDGFRVWPYGEPHDDWLRLDQRRVNNPVVRLSNNQIVGFVEISADGNPDLRDQTNREGLIHNEGLAHLQQLILFAMQILEGERQALRHPGGKRNDRRLARTGTSPEMASLADMIDALAARASGDLADDIRRVAERARSQIAASEMARRRMLDGYSDLAAVGHSASLVGRSLSTCLEDVRALCSSVAKAVGRQDRLSDVVALAAGLQQLRTSIAIAGENLAAVTLTPAGASRRRRGLDVATELQRIREIYAPLLARSGARFDIEKQKGTVLRVEMRPEMFMAIVSAFLANALEWSTRALRFTVAVRATADSIELTFSDNGKGVAPGLEQGLFEPMVSGRDDGSGMGLTIVRNIVTGHGGTVSLVTDRRRRGATFSVTLPRKRSRATANRS